MFKKNLQNLKKFESSSVRPKAMKVCQRCCGLFCEAVGRVAAGGRQVGTAAQPSSWCFVPASV